jgi:hypothetical protein
MQHSHPRRSQGSFRFTRTVAAKAEKSSASISKPRRAWLGEYGGLKQNRRQGAGFASLAQFAIFPHCALSAAGYLSVSQLVRTVLKSIWKSAYMCYFVTLGGSRAWA